MPTTLYKLVIEGVPTLNYTFTVFELSQSSGFYSIPIEISKDCGPFAVKNFSQKTNCGSVLIGVPTFRVFYISSPS